MAGDACGRGEVGSPTQPHDATESTPSGTQVDVAITATTVSERAFLSLTGQEARAFELPPGMHVVWRDDDPKFGFARTRYQQVVAGAEVRGGQIAVTRDAKGEQLFSRSS